MLDGACTSRNDCKGSRARFEACDLAEAVAELSFAFEALIVDIEALPFRQGVGQEPLAELHRAP